MPCADFEITKPAAPEIPWTMVLGGVGVLAAIAVAAYMVATAPA